MTASYRIAVAGEFNSGKSSVINLLFRRRLLPATALSSGAPPAFVRAAGDLSYALLRPDGSLGDQEAFLTGALPEAALRSVEIGAPAPGLDGAVFVEVPLRLDNSTDERTRQVLSQADMLIWCTMAQRAWTLTEILFFDNLPARLRGNAVLAVTRRDLLSDPGARKTVGERLANQALGRFDEIVFVDCSRRSVAAATDDDAWHAFGGHDLCSPISAKLDHGR